MATEWHPTFRNQCLLNHLVFIKAHQLLSNSSTVVLRHNNSSISNRLRLTHHSNIHNINNIHNRRLSKLRQLQSPQSTFSMTRSKSHCLLSQATRSHCL